MVIRVFEEIPYDKKNRETLMKMRSMVIRWLDTRICVLKDNMENENVEAVKIA